MSESQTVTTIGDGRADSEPDILVIALGVEVTATSPTSALDEMADVLGRTRAAVLAAGVEEAALQTSRLSVQPEWDYNARRPRMTGYAARVGLTVRLGDPRRLGDVLGPAVEAGGDAARVSSIGWRISDPAAAESVSREAAFVDARNKAEQFAVLAGRSLGPVLRIEQSGELRSVRSSGTTFVAASAVSDMEVDPGEVGVSTSVTVTWELV